MSKGNRKRAWQGDRLVEWAEGSPVMRRKGIEGVWVRSPQGANFLRRGRFQSARALKNLLLVGIEPKPPLSPYASYQGSRGISDSAAKNGPPIAWHAYLQHTTIQITITSGLGGGGGSTRVLFRYLRGSGKWTRPLGGLFRRLCRSFS